LEQERSTRLVGSISKPAEKYTASNPVTSDLSALYEILRSGQDVKTRLDAAAYLLKLIDEDREIDGETITVLYNSEKDIAVATALKRVLNKIRIRRKLSKDPTASFDRKLSPEETLKVQKEIDRLRSLYDKVNGQKGAFDQKYHRLEKIGEGGMAGIFRAIRHQDNQIVVIKFLLLEKLSRFAEKDRLISRFRREGELLIKRLQHPGIIEGYEYGEADGEHFIVLEYMAGGSLEKMIAGKPLDFPIFKEMALQLCDAVRYIHGQGIIHRDINPGNVLIANSSHLKLADFGLAKDKKDARISRFSYSAGTDDFASPQQLADARNADERDDIFSLGKTFYEMLTSRILKDGEIYRPVALDDKSCSDAVNALILKCIAHKREDRWQDIDDLEEALKRIG